MSILKIKEGSENYVATVVVIKDIFSIEGADFICRTVIFGNNVIISNDVKVGDKMIYFCSGTKLNPEYCKYNNLYSDSEYNKDKDKKGFLSYKQSRVKAIRLRGVISDGLLMPLESIVNFYNRIDVTDSGQIISMNYGLNINVLDFKEGDSFNYIKDTLICEKYIVPVRNSNPGGKAPKQPSRISRLVENQFYLHGDTSNLRRNIDKINPNDIIGIHYKKHGCNIVMGNVLVKRELSWFEKLLKRFGVSIVDTEYDIVYSSRKVIKNEHLNPESGGGFYGEDIWGVVAKEVGHLIPKGWTLYGEVIGFLPSGGYIQKDYDYGCSPESLDEQYKSGHSVYKEKPQHKFYVYKISVVNTDGKVIYLTDKQIEEYCEKVGLLYKDTFIYYGTINNLFESREFQDWDILGGQPVKESWQETLLDYLEYKYNEKDCYMCTNKVPEEGIVLRVERLESYEAYKLKSKRFLFLSSELQEQGIVDIEDNN